MTVAQINNDFARQRRRDLLTYSFACNNFDLSHRPENNTAETRDCLQLIVMAATAARDAFDDSQAKQHEAAIKLKQMARIAAAVFESNKDVYNDNVMAPEQFLLPQAVQAYAECQMSVMALRSPFLNRQQCVALMDDMIDHLGESMRVATKQSAGHNTTRLQNEVMDAMQKCQEAIGVLLEEPMSPVRTVVIKDQLRATA